MAEADPQNDLLAPAPPWLLEPLLALLGSQGSLHHGLLLSGPPGIGKGAFARQLAASLLCEAPGADGLACRQCASCQWMLQLQHPDLRLIMPESLDPQFVPSGSKKPSREIKIEQVRELAGFMAVGAHRGGWRIVIIDPAEAMNGITANGLLKTLEEPGPQTLLLLVSSHDDRLPATIRSRCRRVPLRAPDEADALQWLLAAGAPDEDTARRALRAAGSPMHALVFIEPAEQAAHQSILETLAALPDTADMKAVDALDRHDPKQWAGVLQRWIADLARVLAGLEPHYYPQMAGRMTQLASATDLDRVTRLQTALVTLEARINHPLNTRLLCESSVLAYCKVFGAGRSNR